jgi:putative flavoprotein involved in K+ transport
VFGHDGALLQQRGVTPAAGLYVLGLPWMHSRGSAPLGWVGDDAAHIAVHVAANADTSPTSTVPLST